MKFFCLIALFLVAPTINLAQNHSVKKVVMKRYMVERSFPEGLDIPLNEEGCLLVQGVVSRNSEEHVVRIHSYVLPTGRKLSVYTKPPLLQL